MQGGRGDFGAVGQLIDAVRTRHIQKQAAPQDWGHGLDPLLLPAAIAPYLARRSAAMDAPFGLDMNQRVDVGADMQSPGDDLGRVLEGRLRPGTLRGRGEGKRETDEIRVVWDPVVDLQAEVVDAALLCECKRGPHRRRRDAADGAGRLSRKSRLHRALPRPPRRATRGARKRLILYVMARHANGRLHVAALLDRTAFEQLYEMRLLLEPEAAALALAEAAPAALATLSACVATMTPAAAKRSPADYAAFVGADAMFHEAIARIGRNRFLFDAVRQLHSHHRLAFLYRNHGVIDWQIARREHAAIAAAIDGRNPVRARQSMRDHITRSREVLRRQDCRWCRGRSVRCRFSSWLLHIDLVSGLRQPD